MFKELVVQLVEWRRSDAGGLEYKPRMVFIFPKCAKNTTIVHS